MAQQRRGVIEDNQVQSIARNLAAERTGQTPDRVLDRRRTRGTFVVEQHRDVDIALAARGAACPASVQPGETYRRVAAQGVCKTVAQASNVVVAGGHGHVNLSLGSLVGPAPRPRRAEDKHRPARPQRWSGGHRKLPWTNSAPREPGVGHLDGGRYQLEQPVDGSRYSGWPAHREGAQREAGAGNPGAAHTGGRRRIHPVRRHRVREDPYRLDTWRDGAPGPDGADLR